MALLLLHCVSSVGLSHKQDRGEAVTSGLPWEVTGAQSMRYRTPSWSMMDWKENN